MDTDDLRESPNVELAERLIGKGFDVRIYDPIVNPDQLFGANLRHLQSKLVPRQPAARPPPEEALEGAEVVVVSSLRPRDAQRRSPRRIPALVIDLHGRLGDDVEQHRRLPGGRLVTATRPGPGVAPGCSSSSRTCPCRSTGGSGWSARPWSAPATTSPSSARAARAPAANRSSTACGSTPTARTPRAAARSASCVEYAYSFLATARLALKARRQGAVRRRPGLQPAGHLLAAGLVRCAAATARASSSTTTTCAPSSSSPGSPTEPGCRSCKGLLFLERATFRTADRVTSTNESYAAAREEARRQGAPTTSPSCAPGPTRTPEARSRHDPDLRRGRDAPGRLPRRDGTAGRRRHRARAPPT